MKKIELYLLYMNSLKKESQSIDIYFDKLIPEFVVKIHDVSDKPCYFRNSKLKTSIKDATAYLLAQNGKDSI